ncbi:MAG: DUF6134 family protein [Pseudomonadota bacterium]
MNIKTAIATIAATILAAPSFAAFGDSASEYTFTVMRDGDPVGRHRFVFERYGDSIEIQEATEITVSFASIPLYTFEYEGRQLWQDGRAVRIDAITDDNGEKYDISVRDTDQGYVRTVNGRVDSFDESTAVLAFWNTDTLEHDSFFSAVEDKVLDAKFEFLGTEEIKVGGQKVETQHYRMVGDEERELWFDPDGHVAKVAFDRMGSSIEYVRDQLNARAPEADCTAIC